jgi:hypothetical protein
MSASVFRRGGRALVDDAVDRIRCDVPAFALLHLLPSLAFFAATLRWFVQVDLRGATPSDDGAWIVLLLVPKIVGFGALSAWAAAAARGKPCGVGAAWATALRRLPEVALCGAVYLLSATLGIVSLVGFLGVPLALTAAAATVSDARPGGLAALKQGWGAASDDLGRSFVVLVVAFLAWTFLALNLLVLLPLAIAFGAGGFGVDLSLAAAGLGLDRAATWAFAGLTASMLLEGVVVVAFAELQRDREAEREGTRFEAFAAELEARSAAPPRATKARVA